MKQFTEDMLSWIEFFYCKLYITLSFAAMINIFEKETRFFSCYRRTYAHTNKTQIRSSLIMVQKNMLLFMAGVIPFTVLSTISWDRISAAATTTKYGMGGGGGGLITPPVLPLQPK
jgi:hypothetical protein